jgi:hypothetical protein
MVIPVVFLLLVVVSPTTGITLDTDGAFNARLVDASGIGGGGGDGGLGLGFIGQSRETGNIGYTRRRQTNQKHNAICVGHHYA